MRVLFLSPVVPWPPDSGGRIRTAKLLKVLNNHAEVHLWAVEQPGVDPEAREMLSQLSADVRFFPRSDAGFLRGLSLARAERWFHSSALEEALGPAFDRGRYDLLHLDEPCLARAVGHAPPPAVCVHHHKLDSLLHERLPDPSAVRKRFESIKLLRMESAAAERFRHHVLTSRDDARVLAERFPHLDITVVPSGFDAEYFAPCLRPPLRAQHTLLFLGTMDYAPNVDGLRWFVRDILPRVVERFPEVQLEVVGRAPTPEVVALASARVRVLGGVEDVRPHIERATCLIAPLRIGGGTRLKLFEALALRTPVVATPAAAESLELVHEQHLLVASDPASFALALERVFTQRAFAADLAAGGRRRALERYTWDVLGRSLLDAWQRACDGLELQARA